MTTTTESKINLIQYTTLNPCTSGSSNCSDETRVDISGSQQVESSGNQDQATDQKELNPQDDDAIGPQASKDDPPPGLPTPAQSPVVPIAAPPATPIAAPTAPATPPGPQSSNYDQLLWSREQQPQQPQQPQQLHIYTPPEPAVPSIEQRPRQGLGYSKEVAIIVKIYIDLYINRILINKLVIAY